LSFINFFHLFLLSFILGGHLSNFPLYWWAFVRWTFVLQPCFIQSFSFLIHLLFMYLCFIINPLSGVGGTLGDDNKLLSTNGLLRLTHYKGGTYDLYHIYFVYLFTCVKDCLDVVFVSSKRELWKLCEFSPENTFWLLFLL